MDLVYNFETRNGSGSSQNLSKRDERQGISRLVPLPKFYEIKKTTEI